MPTIARLSHVGFNVPRPIFEQECEFWEKVIGLKRNKGEAGRVAFFAADPLRDHEFILYAVDADVPGYGDKSCMLNHVAFDVATDAEVDAFTARIREYGIEVDEPDIPRHQNKVTSPAGVHFEIGTPPYLRPSTKRS
ncbi:MAG: hypothetical protein QOF51_3532 [Chloroflexota bacterium]|jgi:catechol 2,3-dioxygenase-like lactoylglutathione lyase family enzyme|nr:hypothetical protein [Chloroflexota bacterium]